ncbi:MAG: PHP domain-containing protein [Treponema sp.]|nr:PHP domain-containing protein [Treponema sp.]
MKILSCEISEYSFGESVEKIPDIVRKVKRRGKAELALIDRNLAGTLEFYKCCRENGIKPIFGQKIRLGEENIALFCKDFEAYKILCRNSLALSSTLNEKEIPFTKEEASHLICSANHSDFQFLQNLFGKNFILPEDLGNLADEIPCIFPDDYFEPANSLKRRRESGLDFDVSESIANLKEKYGSDHVARIAAFGYTRGFIHRGLHATGHIITKEAVCNYVPIFKDERTGEICCQYSWKEVSDWGVCKWDF